MAGAQNSIWPMATFSFRVEFTEMGKSIYFQEAFGLDSEENLIEYRSGDSQVFSTIKMPGIQKHGNVTLKKGVFPNDNEFWDWVSHIRMNTIMRETLRIQLLDDAGNATITWVLSNAFPTKITETDLKETNEEVGVETVEFSYEALEIS